MLLIYEYTAQYYLKKTFDYTDISLLHELIKWNARTTNKHFFF